MIEQLQTLNKQTLINIIGDEPSERLKFIASFLKQSQESLKKFVQLYNQDDYSNIREEAHFLKTSANAIGAEKVGDILQQLEDYAVESHKAKCKILIQHINVEVKQVYVEFKNDK
jgi:HPt (histidine-containing phosphotransfer) domain-containing protein